MSFRKSENNVEGNKICTMSVFASSNELGSIKILLHWLLSYHYLVQFEVARIIIIIIMKK